MTQTAGCRNFRVAWLAASVALSALPVAAQPAPAPTVPVASTPAGYDEALARRLGADDMGMRGYVLVVLKTGPNRMPDGPERDAMFRDHFANIKRLADVDPRVLHTLVKTTYARATELGPTMTNPRD